MMARDQPTNPLNQVQHQSHQSDPSVRPRDRTGSMPAEEVEEEEDLLAYLMDDTNFD
jgi:hypothetical protein